MVWLQHPTNTDYFVSPNGQVYCIDGWIVAQNINNNGYARVAINQRRTLVHRLVAETYLKPRRGRAKLVNHIDGDKLNNHYTNLEWCTQKQNMKHYYRLKRHNIGTNTHDT